MIRGILAHDAYWGIGKNGDLPWPKNTEDLQWFKESTAGDVVVMGRKTWESLPRKPLPGRVNYVITSDPNITEGYYGRFTSENIGSAIKAVIEDRFIDQNIWIIGGAQLVESCLPIINELWLNNVGGDYECDVFLPKQKITELFQPGTTETKAFGIITKWIRR
jgi:dihydrofolate reductase